MTVVNRSVNKLLAFLAICILQRSSEAFSPQIHFQGQQQQQHHCPNYFPRPTTSTRLVSRTYQLPEEVKTQFPRPTLADSITESRGAFGRLAKGLGNVIRFDKEKFAKVGVSFALTYSFISNINGSISLSVAWYMASMHTGMSPLAPGNWKSLLAAYGGLYVFITLMRPLRVGLAMALVKKTDAFLDNVQERFNCSRPQAIGVQVSLALLLWFGCIAGGVTTASALSGVPIFHR